MNKSFFQTRDKLEIYFDKTASQAWERLTSDLPVSGIRKSVRNGRNQMREILLSSLPKDLGGMRILDAGCGTGQLTCELARRGANVLATDISKTLIEIAKDRLPPDHSKKVQFKVGDMMDPKNGDFDYVVAMDSLIHYPKTDILSTLINFSQRTSIGVSFTLIPTNLILWLKLSLGKLLPKSDRSPQICPVNSKEFIKELGTILKLEQLGLVNSSGVISTGFYTSEAMVITK